jgi:hypothetical protein
MSDVSALGMAGSSLSEEALKRHQQLLQELHTRRLQEKLLKSIMGAEALEDPAGLGFFIDQLALNDVSALEKRWLSTLEREAGIPLQGSGSTSR